MVEKVSVRAEWDPEAEVWYVAETSLPGLNAEGDSVEELVAILPGMVQDLLEEGGSWHAGEESPPFRWS
jgi:predicted RNase H-like HicB family nuclease